MENDETKPAVDDRKVAYKMSFQKFDVIPLWEGLTDVVAAIHYKITATDGVNSASSVGVANLPRPAVPAPPVLSKRVGGRYQEHGVETEAPAPFVQYKDITRQWAEDMVREFGGEELDHVKETVSLGLETEVQPHVVSKAVPFADA